MISEAHLQRLRMTREQNVVVADALPSQRFAHRQEFIARGPFVFGEAKEKAHLLGRIASSRRSDPRRNFDHVADDGLPVGVFEFGFLRAVQGQG